MIGLTFTKDGWPDFKPGLLYLTDAEIADPTFQEIAHLFTVVRVRDTWAEDAAAVIRATASPHRETPE